MMDILLWTFFLVNIFYHSTLCPIRCSLYLTLFPVKVFYFSTFFPVWCLLPALFCNFIIIYHSTFCPWDVFYHSMVSCRPFVQFDILFVNFFLPQAIFTSTCCWWFLSHFGASHLHSGPATFLSHSHFGPATCLSHSHSGANHLARSLAYRGKSLLDDPFAYWAASFSWALTYWALSLAAHNHLAGSVIYSKWFTHLVSLVKLLAQRLSHNTVQELLFIACPRSYVAGLGEQ